MNYDFNEHDNGVNDSYLSETKYCTKCGAKIAKEAVICPACGCSTKPDAVGLAICAMVFGILGSILGLILGAIGLGTCKEPLNRKRCKIGIGFSIGWIVLGIIIAVVFFSVIYSAFFKNANWEFFFVR